MSDKTEQEQLYDLSRQGYTEDDGNVIIQSGSVVSTINTTLINPHYDVDEMKKILDTDITELNPFVPAEREDVVPRSLYDERLAEISQLQTESIQLENEISNQLDIINRLLQDSASLESLYTSVLRESEFYKTEYNTSIETINNLTVDLGNAINDSINAKIVNVSLEAKVAGLEAERNTLKEQVEQLTDQLEGGEITEQLGAKLIPSEVYKIIASWELKSFKRYGRIHTPAKEYVLRNESTQALVIDMVRQNDWFNFSIAGGGTRIGNSGEVYQLESGEDIVITLWGNPDSTRKLSNGTWKATSSKTYNTKLLIQVTGTGNASELTEDLEIPIEIKQYHKWNDALNGTTIYYTGNG